MESPDVNSGQWLVSTEGGTQPLWARNSQELFYAAPDGTLSSVRVERSATWVAGTPRELLDGQYFLGTGVSGRTYDVSVDGQRFLMIKDATPGRTAALASIVVVQNWFEELKRLVPTN